MSTGYIAGGAIAGVVIGFLSFSDTIPQALAHWQYNTYASRGELSFDELAREAARDELGWTVKEELTKEEKQEVEKLAGEIKELNGTLPQKYVTVPARTELKLPGNKTYRTMEEAYLRDIAAEQLGSADKAQLLYEDNKKRLQLPERLPVGVAVKLPQSNTPALIAFGVLTLFLVLVGTGWLLATPAVAAPRTPPTAGGNP